MSTARTDRMLRELYAGPPLRFFEDLFAVRDIVAELLAEIRKPGEPELISNPALASVAGGSASR